MFVSVCLSSVCNCNTKKWCGHGNERKLKSIDWLGGLQPDRHMLFWVGLRPTRCSHPFGVHATILCFRLACSWPDALFPLDWLSPSAVLAWPYFQDFQQDIIPGLLLIWISNLALKNSGMHQLFMHDSKGL